uniref:Translation initiation factor 3 N-terminal domain-containing protein n=1 Tax=Glossina brevipalpis TaxID=37001 RepID=A0A1A9WV25_9MUSC
MSLLLKSIALLNNIRFLTKSENFRDVWRFQATVINTHLWKKQISTTPNEEKKAQNTAKITLIQNQNVSTVTTLEEAKNLAKRRSMHLVQIQKMDTKTQRPVYKLLTNAEMLSEELSDLKSKVSNTTPTTTIAKPTQKKADKSLSIGSRINEHDLNARLKNISKWLSKGHEVRILIQGMGGDTTNCDKIFKTIENFVKTPENITLGKIVQKHSKGTVIKFNILPLATTTISTESDKILSDDA